MRTLVLLIVAAFLSSGCGKVQPCVPKTKYIKSEVPRLRILNKVEPYKIVDYTVISADYDEVNSTQLSMAAAVSRKRNDNILFYEDQIRDLNKKFGRK